MSVQCIVANKCILCNVMFSKTRSETFKTECCEHKFHSNCLDKIEGDTCPCCPSKISRSLKFKYVESKIEFANTYSNCKIYKRSIKSVNKNLFSMIRSLRLSIIQAKREIKNANQLMKNGVDILHQSNIIDVRVNTIRDLTEKRNNFIATIDKYNIESSLHIETLKNGCQTAKNHMTSLLNEIQVKRADRKFASI